MRPTSAVLGVSTRRFHVFALGAATGVETILGDRIGRMPSPHKTLHLSVVVFAIIGWITILISMLPPQ